MPPSQYSRVAVTIPRDVLAAADRVAKALDRSRSWIAAEAIRQFVGVRPSLPATARTPPVAGLGLYRTAQLDADLRLSPEARVRAAEDTARATRRRLRGRIQRVIAFEHYEDYLDWKELEGALG